MGNLSSTAATKSPSRASPLTWRQPCEGEQAVAGFLEAVGDRAMAQPPLADEGLAALLDLLGRGRIDHVGVVGGHLVVQSLGRMREQVPMLMHGASLHRDTVPHGGKRLLQPRCAVNDEEPRSAKSTALTPRVRNVDCRYWTTRSPAPVGWKQWRPRDRLARCPSDGFVSF